jgi:ABC-type amino acid transport substrate-binding protein
MNDKLIQIKKKSNSLTNLSLLLSTIAILTCLFLFFNQRKNNASSENKETTMERIKRTGTIRVAYGGFPPYTIVDLKDTTKKDQVKGYCIDMVNEIANRCEPKLKVEWYNLSWENFNADMQSGKFDFLADGVFATVPKALDFNFTEPFSYFGLCVAVVRKDDNRFVKFEDLNRSDITISYAKGYVSGDYAKAHLDKPKFKDVLVGDDAFVQLDDVINGRADVAVQDVPTVVQYVNSHKDKVKALWLDNPPTRVAGCFVTQRNEIELLQFLNTSIRILQTDGTLDKLDKKWSSMGYFENKSFTKGAGIK